MTNTLQIKLLVLSGDIQKIKDKIQEVVAIQDSHRVTVVRIDEKSLAKFRQMLKLVRQDKHSLFVFGSKNLEVQRYQFPLKFFLLFARAKEKFIIDEVGNISYFSYWGYLFFDVPNFCLEVLLSTLAVMVLYVRLLHLKGKLTRKTLARQ